MRIAHLSSPKLKSAVVVSPLFLPSTFSFLIFSPNSKPSQILTMADAESFSTISAEVEEDAKYGFKREEMYSTNLANTVTAYNRHVFLCHKGPDTWGPRVETESLPKVVATAFKARKDEMIVKTIVTVCEGGEGESDGDVLIFPEKIKYSGLKDSDVDSFVDDVLVNDKPWASGVPETFAGSYIFVCAHGSRDKRCGVCGPVLIEKLNQEIELRGLKDQIFVKACSHIGGHKYAGNLIIYSPDSEGKTMGHWYGYVTPDDVPDLLDQHIAKGNIIEKLWRGQMGGSVEENEPGGEKKLPNGEHAEKSKKDEEKKSEKTNEVAGGCCQGANGVSCCRDVSFEATGKEKAGKLSSWIKSLDQTDVLTAAGVITAVATVGVAYSFYRRSA